MTDAFATVDEVQSRLDFTMSVEERGVCEGALEDLSIDARTYGRDTWTAQAAPPAVKSLVLRAAARFMRNFDGYNQSRAGDESVGWQETGRQADTAEFHPTEIARLRALRGITGFGTIDINVYGTNLGGSELRVAENNGTTIPFVHSAQADWYTAMANRNA